MVKLYKLVILSVRVKMVQLATEQRVFTVLHAELIKLITVAHNHILNETKTIKQPIHA